MTGRLASRPKFPLSCHSSPASIGAVSDLSPSAVMSKRWDHQATNKARDSTGNPCRRTVYFGLALLLVFSIRISAAAGKR